MALRGIDNQILITKSQDVSAERARIQQNQNQHQGMTAQQLKLESDRAEERPQEVSETEDGRIGLDDRRAKPGNEQEKEDEQQQKEEEFREEVSAATQKMLGLPVERGRFAKRQEHQIDIIV